MPKGSWNRGRGKCYRWLVENSTAITDECIVWPFPLDAYGYGQFGHNNMTRKAHRASYELNRGPITGGLHVCHRCDNRACVNPNHLFLATNAENTADKMAKGRYGTGQGAPPGERHGRAKLREADVIAIRSSRETLRALSERYGVSQGHIWRLRKGLLWSCLSQQKTSDA